MEVERFTPYLGIVAALLVGIVATVFFGGASLFQNHVAISSATSSATSSIGVVSSPLPVSPVGVNKTSPTATSSLSNPAPETTRTETAVPAAAATPPQTKTVPRPVAAAPSATAVPTAPHAVHASSAALDTVASQLRGALVNILCYVPPGSGLHSISGSGVIIDSKGIILTNAHIAQYFLLADRGVSCSIRTGSPAADTYSAALIYLPAIWLNVNKSVITQASPSGTGEYDFALLAVTHSETAQPLPSTFPSIPLATMPPLAGTPVVIASYGAQFLDTSQVESSLFPTIVFGSVKDIFTFAVRTIDVLSLGGSAAAQEGSSGGGVADADGQLVATITTSTIEGATDTRTLGAITASYIRAEYATETGQPLDMLLAKPTSATLTDFAPRVSSLEAIITTQLSQR